MQTIFRNTALGLGTAMLALAAPVQASHHMDTGSPDIVATASANEDFETLVAAVKAADLAEVLSGEGPFTVFAPTDAAFAALPEGTLDSLLLAENKATLANILTYHVVAGEVKAADLVALIEQGGGEAVVATVAGGSLTARVKDGMVALTDAAGREIGVAATDIATANGVIHVLDGVLLPG